jgi:hypothetical protein
MQFLPATVLQDPNGQFEAPHATKHACRLYHMIGYYCCDVSKSSPALPSGRPWLLLTASSLPSGCCLVFKTGGRCADAAANNA